MQDELFHEDFREALRHCVSALGGAKKVALTINPSLTPSRAGSWLSNCLDDRRPEKLDLEQIILILKLARAEGVHSAFHFLAGECGYEAPKTIEPEDERDALMRQFIESQKHLEKISKRLERNTSGPSFPGGHVSLA